MTTLPVPIAKKSRSRHRLDGLQRMAFQHPSDLAMLSRLERVPVLPTIMGKVIDIEKEQVETRLFGSAFHVTQESLPEVYSLFLQACNNLCVDSPPPLYIMPSSDYNGFTMGCDTPYVCLNSGLVSAFDDDELIYVMGHEIGHILSGHVRYHTLVDIVCGAGMASLSGYLGPFAILAKLATDTTLTPLLLLWNRLGEYSCDRAGLLACQSLEATHRALLKMSGFPAKYFDKICSQSILEQSKAFRERTSGSWLSRAYAWQQQLNATHPRTIERAVELQQWVDGGWYDEIVNGNADSRTKLAQFLSGDSLMAELMLIVSQSLIVVCVKELDVPREIAFPLIRQVLYKGGTLKNTPLEAILEIELSVEKIASKKVHYFVVLHVNLDGFVSQQKFQLPMSEEWSDIPQEIREEFTKNKGQSVVIRQLYSHETLAVTRITRDFQFGN